MSYADVNGLSLYYEEHGSGESLVLLHGGFGAAELLGPMIPALAARPRQGRRAAAPAAHRSRAPRSTGTGR